MKTAITETTEQRKLTPVAAMILQAVDAEIKGDVVARHKVNQVSPTFPLDRRSMANRDSLGIGVKDYTIIGGRRFYSKKSLLEFLRQYLLEQKVT